MNGPRRLFTVRNTYLWPVIVLLSIQMGDAWGQSGGGTQSSNSSQVWIAEPGDTSLNRWEPRQLFEEKGEVLDWTSKQIVIRRSGAKFATTVPGNNVVRIEPGWANESLEKIHRLFLDRQFQRAVVEGGALVNKSGDSKLPLWQVQVILADMVESCSALEKPQMAGKIFVALSDPKGEDKAELPLLLLSTIPLPWGEKAMVDADLLAMKSLGEEWLSSDVESVQLLGAAWLVSGEKRNAAIAKLESLGRTAKSQTVAAYAKSQLWRTVPPAEMMSDRLPRWIAERDRMPVPVQAGPTMLLADCLEKAGQPNLAISEWLRIATLHADRYHLATKATLKASAALRTLGQTEEADRVQSMLDRQKQIDKSKSSPTTKQ